MSRVRTYKVARSAANPRTPSSTLHRSHETSTRTKLPSPTLGRPNIRRGLSSRRGPYWRPLRAYNYCYTSRRPNNRKSKVQHAYREFPDLPRDTAHMFVFHLVRRVDVRERTLVYRWQLDSRFLCTRLFSLPCIDLAPPLNYFRAAREGY